MRWKCLFAHKWGKYSEPKYENWVRMFGNRRIGEYTKIVQTRTCNRCGKFERVWIDTIERGPCR